MCGCAVVADCRWVRAGAVAAGGVGAGAVGYVLRDNLPIACDPQLLIFLSEGAEPLPPSPPYLAFLPAWPAGLSDGSGPQAGGNRELEGLADESDVFAAPRLVAADGAALETR